MSAGPGASVLVLAMSALALASLAGAAEPARARKPRLELRATPRMALTPVTVFVTAELRGGDEAEDFYCPSLEWDWDDGGRSVHEADCPPFRPGMELERRFTAEHAYHRPGSYSVKITLRRAARALAAATTLVEVRSGFGGPE
jgi:hypothetical protein